MVRRINKLDRRSPPSHESLRSRLSAGLLSQALGLSLVLEAKRLLLSMNTKGLLIRLGLERLLELSSSHDRLTDLGPTTGHNTPQGKVAGPQGVVGDLESRYPLGPQSFGILESSDPHAVDVVGSKSRVPLALHLLQIALQKTDLGGNIGSKHLRRSTDDRNSLSPHPETTSPSLKIDGHSTSPCTTSSTITPIPQGGHWHKGHGVVISHNHDAKILVTGSIVVITRRTGTRRSRAPNPPDPGAEKLRQT